jgi:hypothetical protein
MDWPACTASTPHVRSVDGRQRMPSQFWAGLFPQSVCFRTDIEEAIQW